jgi:hypothetical protein
MAEFSTKELKSAPPPQKKNSWPSQFFEKWQKKNRPETFLI